MIDDKNKLPELEACPRCGVSNALRVGQSNQSGKLRWYEVINCSSCGLHSEADGVGIAPSEIRNLLIKMHGLWAIRIDDIKSTANILKVLRSSLSLDMKDASSLIKILPGSVYSGTKAEAEWLANLLIKAGEVPTLEQLSDAAIA